PNSNHIRQIHHDHRTINCSDSGYGSGRNSTTLTTLKMAVLAPIPSARVSTATAVKAGCMASIRKAYRKSWRTACMDLLAAQGHDWIDPAGAARRDPASKESGADKHRSDLKVDPRVNAA